MSRSARILFLCFLFLGLNAMAQRRLVPHVTHPDGGFDTKVIIANASDKENSYRLIAYELLTGHFQAEYSGTIAAKSNQLKTLDELFGSPVISHFEIIADANIHVAVTFQTQQPQPKGFAPCHVNESNRSSTVWRIYTGNSNITWDGLAIVNTGDRSTPLTFISYDISGNYIGFISPYYYLEPNEKEVYLISDFEGSSNVAYWELSTTEPVSVLGLRGDLSGGYFWENVASDLSLVEATKSAQKNP